MTEEEEKEPPTNPYQHYRQWTADQCQEILKSDKTNPYALTRLAFIYLEDKKLPDAEEALSIILSISKFP